MSLPSLRVNIFSLGIIQIANYGIPLLILPHFIRVLGSKAYGEVVFIQTVMVFGGFLVEFGFNWSATRKISECRFDIKKVSRIFSNTWFAQWLLSASFAAFLVILSIFSHELQQHSVLYLVGFGMIVGQVLFPVWLFQGLEALRAVAIIQFFGKLSAIPIVLFFVNDSSDRIWALFFYTASNILTGGISLLWLVRNKMVDWIHPDGKEVFQTIRSGALLFFSRISTNISMTLMPLAVGAWADATQLAYFSVAEKIRNVIQSLLAPISQALFPRMIFLFGTNRQAAYSLLKKSGFYTLLISGFIGLSVWLLSEWIMVSLGGDGFSEGAEVLRWLAFAPFAASLTNVFGVQIMLPLGMNKIFSSILTISSVVVFFAAYPIIKAYAAVGAAQLVFYIECFVAILMGIIIFRKLYGEIDD
jgi:O-antigen/teichoic acid export membrane protein